MEKYNLNEGSDEEIKNIVEAFIKTDFEGGRHKRRIDKIDGND